MLGVRPQNEVMSYELRVVVENLRFSYVFERVCVSTAETRLQAMNVAAGFRFAKKE